MNETKSEAMNEAWSEGDKSSQEVAHNSRRTRILVSLLLVVLSIILVLISVWRLVIVVNKF